MNVYLWTDTPWTVTETYTMSNISWWTRIWTSNLYKSWYKITKIVQEWTITCTSSNEARQWIFNDTSQTLWTQSYYWFSAYQNAPEAIEKHYNNTWYRMKTLSSSYYSTTVNFRRETTATQIKTSYNWHTMTYNLTSEEVWWFKPILEWNSVYCTSQISNYGGTLWTVSAVTVTVTYEQV